MSWFPNAVPVTSMKRSSASRVTVRSHSMPPRVFSIWVYVTVPVPRSTSFADSRWRNAAASGPLTSILAKLDSSNRPARSRVATCSAAIALDQCSPAHPRGRSLVERRILVRREPVRPLPARLLAELRPEVGEPRVRRRRLERPSRLPLLARIVDVVVRRVDLDGPLARVVPRPVLRAEPADVHLPQVVLRLAVHDPVRHDLADRRRRRRSRARRTRRPRRTRGRRTRPG